MKAAVLHSLPRGGTLGIFGFGQLFYERDLRSVTSNTRQDGEDLLREAARIPIHPEVRHDAFDDVNKALQDLKSDRISGTALVRASG